jgi:hypothetical protein
MPYDTTDLRSQLASAPAHTRAAGTNRSAEYFEFLELEPDEVSSAGSRSWFVRSQTSCVDFTIAVAGDRFARQEQPDEYVVLLPAAGSGAAGGGASARFTAGDESIDVAAGAVVIVPAGQSELLVTEPGVVVRVLSTRSADLVARCRNRDVYADADPNVAPFSAWPDPPGGARLRAYRLDDHEPSPDRFGRLLRSSTVMVNYFYPDDGPRDPARLSPHHHDDFEQLSLQLEGDYVHHIRTPWTVNLADWREDDHRHCSSPALTIIPPPAIHTSQAVGWERHQLVDLFCPPRLDFSERPGWVLNHDEYPLP